MAAERLPREAPQAVCPARSRLEEAENILDRLIETRRVAADLGDVSRALLACMRKIAAERRRILELPAIGYEDGELVIEWARHGVFCSIYADDVNEIHIAVVDMQANGISSVTERDTSKAAIEIINVLP